MIAYLQGIPSFLEFEGLTNKLLEVTILESWLGTWDSTPFPSLFRNSGIPTLTATLTITLPYYFRSSTQIALHYYSL